MADLTATRPQPGSSTTPTADPQLLTEKEQHLRIEADIRKQERELRDRTINVETEGGAAMSAMQFIHHVQTLCGALLACRVLGDKIMFELTMSSAEDLPVYQTRTGRTSTLMDNPNNLLVNAEKESGEAARRMKEDDDLRRLTVNLELDGGEVMSPMELISHVQRLCGIVLTCSVISPRKFELTMDHPKGKDRLMEGFKVGETRVNAKEISNDELIVSFLNLPYYVKESDIIMKLAGWGLMAISPIRRRMWPGSKVTDGTRFLRVKFNDRVQSLPYSAKFNTVLGSEYFRVIHDRQIKICRLCTQPGHIQRECPEFSFYTCCVQGHFSRECTKQKTVKCKGCKLALDNCVCHGEVEEMEGMESTAELSSIESNGEQVLHEEADESDVAISATWPERRPVAEETAANEELTPAPVSKEAVTEVTGTATEPVMTAWAAAEPVAAPNAEEVQETALSQPKARSGAEVGTAGGVDGAAGASGGRTVDAETEPGKATKAGVVPGSPGGGAAMEPV